MSMDLFEKIQSQITGVMCFQKEEAVAIADAARGIRVGVISGIHWGDMAILATLAEAGLIYIVDPMVGPFWEKIDSKTQQKPSINAILENFRKFDVQNHIVVIRSNYNPWPLIGIYPDIFIIDGDLSYDGIKHDWTIATQIAQKMIIVHDVDENHPDVIRALEECRSPIWRKKEQIKSLALFERVPSPLISVIVPTYNRPELLQRALDSIMDQTFTDYEVIVVNDGGMDVSDIIKKYPKTIYRSHKENKGLAASRNTAIKLAKGHYIAYLDDDDWYYQKHLDTLLNGLMKHNTRAVYGNAHFIEREREKREIYSRNAYSKDELRKRSLFSVCCVLHERSLYDNAGIFDETLKNHEDWDLWQRVANFTDFVHIDVPTCVIDRTRSTMNTDKEAMCTGFEIVKKRYSKNGAAV